MEKNRLVTEKQVVETMIRLYCQKEHHSPQFCTSCESLLSYAADRIDHCPEGVHKPFCSRCTVHCYKPEMREHIRRVMRFSGPRMLLYHPLVAILHMVSRVYSR